MQTLHHQTDQDRGQDRGPASPQHPMLQGFMADQTTAYADEVRLLRQRVALLEAELAAAKSSRAAAAAPPRQAPPLTSIDFAAAPRSGDAVASVFTEQLTPAVAAALPAAPGRLLTATPVVPEATVPDTPVLDTPVPDTAAPEPEATAEAGFAQAWTNVDDDPSFEERVAERAFFQATSVDEESRSWLLDD